MHRGPSALIGNEEARNFILAHEQEDPYEVSLNHREAGGLPVALLARQIESRRKARSKLPEWYKQNGVIFPDPENLQQASSEAAAKYKARIFQGGPLADLSGGTGIDAYYLAGGEELHFVEPNEELCRLARHNFAILNQKLTIYQESAVSFIDRMASGLRIYIDPSRRNSSSQKTVLFSDGSPDITRILPRLLEKSDRILLKASPMIDIHAARVSLNHHVKEVHILEFAGECKEVLFLLDRSHHDDPPVYAVIPDKHLAFTFRYSEERQTDVEFGPVSGWLYEPSPALMKAGAFNILARRFNLVKVHPNTHLYTSRQCVRDFPGRTFRVTEIRPYNLRNLRAMSKDGKANITVRNFPETVASLRKKSGIRDGGMVYLFLYTASGNERMICQASKPD